MNVEEAHKSRSRKIPKSRGAHRGTREMCRDWFAFAIALWWFCAWRIVSLRFTPSASGPTSATAASSSPRCLCCSASHARAHLALTFSISAACFNARQSFLGAIAAGWGLGLLRTRALFLWKKICFFGEKRPGCFFGEKRPGCFFGEKVV